MINILEALNLRIYTQLYELAKESEFKLPLGSLDFLQYLCYVNKRCYIWGGIHYTNMNSPLPLDDIIIKKINVKHTMIG